MVNTPWAATVYRGYNVCFGSVGPERPGRRALLRMDFTRTTDPVR